MADGRAEGFVLIWPVEDAENQPRVAAEIGPLVPAEARNWLAAATSPLGAAV